MDYGRFLVISIGAGSAKREEKYNAEMASKWGVFGWLLQGSSTPLVDIFTQASADMVDYHLSVVFQALHSEDNYLRIQVGWQNQPLFSLMSLQWTTFPLNVSCPDSFYFAPSILSYVMGSLIIKD